MASSKKEVAFQSKEVAELFRNFQGRMRIHLLRLRSLIFATAASIPGCEISESLKWGEPAYRPVEPGFGTTIRIDKRKSSETGYAMYFHCRTNLVATFRRKYPGILLYEGNRAILFDLDDKVPKPVLEDCIRTALTYHVNKRR